jgi:hypothetical protein
MPSFSGHSASGHVVIVANGHMMGLTFSSLQHNRALMVRWDYHPNAIEELDVGKIHSPQPFSLLRGENGFFFE